MPFGDWRAASAAAASVGRALHEVRARFCSGSHG